MSKLFLKLAFGGAVGLTAFSAQALPSASQHSLVSSDVIQVAGGCGRGFQVPEVGCRPNAVVVVPGRRCAVRSLF
jgi:hypothetical protein